MSNPPSPQKPSRAFPAPCWAHDETVALIHVYRDKSLALGRRTLRSTEWDEVASAVAIQSPSSTSSPKSSLQCRHKIEKLRRRYRAEKQRCASYSGRVFSSWDLFPLLDSVEAGFEPEIPAAAAPAAKTRGTKNPRNGDSDPEPKFPADYRDDVILGLCATNAPKSDSNSKLGQNRGSKNQKPLDSYDPSGSSESDEEIKYRPNSTNRRHQARADRGIKTDPFTEMASSITMLGDEFVRVERMKMEMAREFEKTRMRMEMKRNEMMIESEQMIINALMEAVHGKKKKIQKKMKMEKVVSPESS